MNQKIPQNITVQELDRWLQSDSLQPTLVDVREEQELAIASFPANILHIPLSKANELSKGLLKELSGGDVVILCHSGIRSWNFACWLIEQDCPCKIWNLYGGIDAWSLEIDPSVPRY